MTGDELAPARTALDAARAAKQRADDLTIWWAMNEASDDEQAEVRTHLLRRDGSWAVYRVDGQVARQLAQGSDAT